MEKTINSDFIRGHIDTIILKSLFDGSKHALEISQYIEEKSGNQYEVKQATLYSALKRLETKKFVKPFWNDAPEGGRRRYFTATQAGLDYANKILSEWDYSRDIIDTLIDEVPNNKVHSPTTEINTEKKSDFNVVSENNQNIASENQVINIESNNIDTVSGNVACTKDENTAANTTIVDLRNVENTQVIKNEEIIEHKNNVYEEVNYKQILGDLIDSVQKTSTKVAEIKDTEEQKTVLIKNNDFSDDLIAKNQNTGTIDFSDLIEKSESEGYKLRISSNKTKKIGGKILINKVNLTTSLTFFLIVLIEVLALSISYKKQELFNPVWYFVAVAIFAVYPIFATVTYIKNPLKTINKYNQNIIVTVSVICANLLLFIIAIALLKDVRFDDISQVAVKIIIPILLVFDVFTLFLLKHLVSKNKNFITR